jgi:hypothetical protein
MVEAINIDHFNSVIVRFEKIAVNLENVEKTKKIEQSVRKISLPVVVVKPKNSDQDSFETGYQIKSVFDPMKSEIKGGVVIVCKDKASTQKYNEELGEDYEVSFPESNGPLLKVLGMMEVIPTKKNSLIKFVNKMTVSKIARNKFIYLQWTYV